MIQIDYSAVSIAAIIQFQEDLKRGTEDVENLVRHAVLSSIKNIKRRFKREYGNEVIIACDAESYWRTDVFPHYKYKRKKERDASDIPWDAIHECMDMVKLDLINHFPYKVIEVPKAEADDVIAVLTRDVAPTKTTNNALFDEPEPVLIVSGDKDLKQLLVEKHIKQWIPREQKYAALEMPTKMFLRRLILTGDSSDGVPNVFSPNNSFVTGIRQKAATEKKMQPLLEAKVMLDATDDPAIKERIKENARLISFSFIPENVKDDIVKAYEVPPNGTKMDVFNYLQSKDMKQMLGDLEDF